MASENSLALRDMYVDWAKRMAEGPELPQLRDMFEGWGTLASEPDGVSYSMTTWAGIECLEAVPAGVQADAPILLSFHGGGYVCGSPQSHRKMFGHIAKAANVRALIVDYDRTPENPYPGILNQVHAVYQAILKSGHAANRIALIGDSAGGNLVMASLLAIRQSCDALPAGAVLLSPWLDMEPTGGTMISNAATDVFVTPDAVRFLASMYLNGHPVDDPMVSPIYADLKGLPPLLLQVGGAETLVDDSKRLVKSAINAGVEATIQVFPEMQHVFQLMAGRTPEADRAIQDLSAWLRVRLQT